MIGSELFPGRQEKREKEKMQKNCLPVSERLCSIEQIHIISEVQIHSDCISIFLVQVFQLIDNRINHFAKDS